MKFLKILPSVISKRNLETLRSILSELGQIRKTKESRRPAKQKPVANVSKELKRKTGKISSPANPKTTDNVSKELKSLLWDFRRDNYQVYLKSDEWKAKRRKILKMADYKCRRCGARATQVHHETYKRIYNEKLTDLTALCSDCHSKIHKKG